MARLPQVIKSGDRACRLIAIALAIGLLLTSMVARPGVSFPAARLGRSKSIGSPAQQQPRPCQERRETPSVLPISPHLFTPGVAQPIVLAAVAFRDPLLDTPRCSRAPPKPLVRVAFDLHGPAIGCLPEAAPATREST